MFVRMKTGPYAGEVREFEFATGRELVELGRAERIDFSDPPPAAKPPEPKPAAAAPVAKRKKR